MAIGERRQVVFRKDNLSVLAWPIQTSTQVSLPFSWSISLVRKGSYGMLIALVSDCGNSHNALTKKGGEEEVNTNKPETNKIAQSKPTAPTIQKKEQPKTNPKKPFGKH